MNLIWFGCTPCRLGLLGFRPDAEIDLEIDETIQHEVDEPTTFEAGFTGTFLLTSSAPRGEKRATPGSEAEAGSAAPECIDLTTPFNEDVAAKVVENGSFVEEDAVPTIAVEEEHLVNIPPDTIMDVDHPSITHESNPGETVSAPTRKAKSSPEVPRKKRKKPRR